MSSRTSQKAAARQARLEAEKRAKVQDARRKRLRSLVGVILVAAVFVAVSIAASSGSGAAANAATGGRLVGTALSRNLFAGIPQSGTTIGSPQAPVRLVEFADLQCPYCDEYAVQALPTLVKDYVRTGKVQMRFENLSFIGAGSVAAGKVAAAASQQNKLWNFIDLMYLNQGEENSGYVTPAYLQHLLQAVPAINVRQALNASRSPAAGAALSSANQVAAQDGISATPSFLIGRAGSPLQQFQPSSLTAAPFEAEINGLLGGAK
jgi:protein-disulfide isomerase